jgi:hypothetical protein
MAKRPRKTGIDVAATPAAADLWLGQPLGSPRTLIPGEAVAGTAPTSVELSARSSTRTSGRGVPTLSPGSMTVRSDAADRQRRTIAATVISDAPFSIGDLAEAMVPGERAPASPTPRKRVVRPKTDLGRAFLANNPVIVIHVQSMVSIVDLEIARLQERKRNARLNDPDSNAEFDATITLLQTLKKSLANLQRAAVEFPIGKVGEGKLSKILGEIGVPFREFWKKDGAKHMDNAATMGLICGGFTLACHLGMSVNAASAIAAAVYAHKPISVVLRALKGLPNFFGGS